MQSQDHGVEFGEDEQSVEEKGEVAQDQILGLETRREAQKKLAPCQSSYPSPSVISITQFYSILGNSNQLN